MTKSDDAALFERWRTKRDGDAFAELARRHAPVVYDLAARTLGDRTAAEDVVQEALLDLALEPTDKPALVGVPAWLVRFAICRARNQRSSERSRTRRQHVVGMRRPEETMPDVDIERREELERALAVAEPEERAVLAMRFLHGWEYDQIATALETSQGAARVRVHRALANVRGRLGVGGGRGSEQEKSVVDRMAGLALISMPAARLDAAIRGAIDAANVVPLPTTGKPVPVNRMPKWFRAGAQSFGAMVLVAGAATSSFDSGAQATRAAGDTAAVPADAFVLVADLGTPTRGASSSTVGASTASIAVPRPEDWDGGALARLARGDAGYVSDERTSSRPAPEAPAPVAPAPPAAAPVVPAAQVAEAAAAPVVAPAPVARTEEERPTSAFRPSARGASAANCDPGSSDGERADALGGFKPAAEPVVERVVVAEKAPTTDAAPAEAAVVEKPAVVVASGRRRAAAPSRTIDALEAPERELVDQAVALVRDAVTQATPPAAVDEAAETETKPLTTKALRKAKATTVRALRKQYQAVQKATPRALRATARVKARMNRLIAMLVDIAMADAGADAARLRWPEGVDPTTALNDVIGVLTAAARSTSPRTPDAAPPTAGDVEPAAQPTTPADESRKPDLE